MENLEQSCFELISHMGMARSSYIEAIKNAKKGNLEEANMCILKGKDEYNKGHDTHFALLQEDINGKIDKIPLVLVHAEDQLMSAENFGILAEELVDSLRQITELTEKIAFLEGMVKNL